MAHTLISDQAQILSKHQANIAASLAHRLDIAKATQNSHLLTLLVQEQQQLEKDKSGHSHQGFWHWLTEPAKLSVEKIVSSTGGEIWRAYNSKTGEIRYAETEAGIIDWLETSH